MVSISFNFKKKDLWLFISVAVFLVGAGYVIALNSGDYQLHGHTADEIEGTSGGVEVYDSGWFAVTTGVTYSRQHGFGEEPTMVQLWLSDTADGSGAVLPPPHGRQYIYGMVVVDVDDSEIKIRGPYRIMDAFDADGNVISLADGYARIKAIKV